jgi:hypothetical protein
LKYLNIYVLYYYIKQIKKESYMSTTVIGKFTKPLREKIQKEFRQFVQANKADQDAPPSRVDAFEKYLQNKEENILPVIVSDGADELELINDTIIELNANKNPEINEESLGKPYTVLKQLINNQKLEIHTLLGPAHTGTTAFARTVLQAGADCAIHEPVFATFVDAVNYLLPDQEEKDIFKEAYKDSIQNDPFKKILFAYARQNSLQPESNKPIKILVKEMLCPESVESIYDSHEPLLKEFREVTESLIKISASTGMLHRPVEDILNSGLRIIFNEKGVTEDEKPSIRKDLLEHVQREFNMAQSLLESHPEIPVFDMYKFLKGSEEESLSVVQQASAPITSDKPDPSCFQFGKEYILGYYDTHALPRINEEKFIPHANQPSRPSLWDYARDPDSAENWKTLKALEKKITSRIKQ